MAARALWQVNQTPGLRGSRSGFGIGAVAVSGATIVGLGFGFGIGIGVATVLRDQRCGIGVP